MKSGNHNRDRAQGEKRQRPSWNADVDLADSEQNKNDQKIGNDSGQTEQKREMNAEILAPALFGQSEDAAQIVSGQRGMIKVTAVLVSPLKSMFAQHFRETIEEHSVVGADRVVGDREFQRHRDERDRDNERSTQIAVGVHPCDSSSFSALVGNRLTGSTSVFVDPFL